MSDKPFSIPEIGIWMDESQYIRAVDLIGEAAGLLTEPGFNEEYERGMAELIMRFMGWSSEHVSEILAAIHAQVKP